MNVNGLSFNQKEPRFQGEKPRLRGDLAMYLTLGTLVLWSVKKDYIHLCEKNLFNFLCLYNCTRII